ncbi:hypothetical protein Tco_0309166 [Tanacetum coccineum]
MRASCGPDVEGRVRECWDCGGSINTESFWTSKRPVGEVVRTGGEAEGKVETGACTMCSCRRALHCAVVVKVPGQPNIVECYVGGSAAESFERFSRATVSSTNLITSFPTALLRMDDDSVGTLLLVEKSSVSVLAFS